MATPPKPGARNDLFALREERCHSSAAINRAERAIDEVTRMREGMGRPDYGPINALLGQLALELSKVSTNLDEMMTLRASAKQATEHELAERIEALESQLAQLNSAIKERV